MPTAAGIVWCARDKRWVHDAHLALHAQPGPSPILPVVALPFAAVTVVLGVGLLEARSANGWGYLAVAALLIVGFIAWIACRPLPVD